MYFVGFSFSSFALPCFSVIVFFILGVLSIFLTCKAMGWPVSCTFSIIICVHTI